MRPQLVFLLAGALQLLVLTPIDAITAPGVRMIPATSATGPTVTIVEAPVFPGSGAEAPSGTREFGDNWHRYEPDAIFTTTGAAGYAFSFFSGTYWSHPRQADLTPWYGDGTPTWVYQGTEFYTDAAHMGNTLAALDCTPADSTVRVLEWSPESAVPLYSYALHPCRPLTGEGWSAGKGIQVSGDGSTIAAVVNSFTPGGLRARLCIFDSGSGIPTTDVQLPDGTASALAITWDGAYVAVYAWPSIHVYSRDANALRWSGSAGSGNDAIAISEDGRYLAWGWSTLNVREWDGSAYRILWNKNYGGTYYVTECALYLDRLAVGLYKANTYDDSVIEMYRLPLNVADWVYHYTLSNPPIGEEILPETVDVISEMVFDTGGQLLAACSWGPRFPEIHALNVSDGTASLIAEAPGTMFDVDIVTPVGGDAYMAACGKHVHAGTAGRGGDLYSFWVGVGTDVGDESIPDVAGSRLTVYPNPVRHGAAIRLALGSAGLVRLGVYDMLGRRVAVLEDAWHPAGAFSNRWLGNDDAGRSVPSGVYLLRLNDEEAARVIVAR